MNFLEYVLSPVDVTIISNDKVTEARSKVQFQVTFQIILYLYSRNFRLKSIYFTTTGTFETLESVEKAALVEIISKTDYHK
jgi:hypothetical protein